MPPPLLTIVAVLLSSVLTVTAYKDFINRTDGTSLENIALSSDQRSNYTTTATLSSSARARRRRRRRRAVTQNTVANDLVVNDLPVVFQIPMRHAEGSKWGMVGAIRVGTRKDAYEVMFDTESSNTLMFHKDLEDSEYKTLFNKNNRFYDHKKSGGSNINLSEVRMKYPDGSEYVGGSVEDHLAVTSREGIQMEKMKFSWVHSMNKVAADNRGGDFDGIVGLGSDALPDGNGMGSLMVELVASNNGKKNNNNQKTKKPLLKKNPKFAFYVSNSGDTGELTLGGHNPQLLAEGAAMTYFPALYLTAWDSEEEGGDSNAAAAATKKKSKPVFASDGSSLMWGIMVDELAFGEAQVDIKISALFSSTLPYGLAVPNHEYLELFTGMIGNGAKVENGELVIECDKLDSGDLPDLRFKVTDHVLKKDHVFSFTPKEYFPTEGASHHQLTAIGFGKKKTPPPVDTRMKGAMCHSFFGVVKGSGDDHYGGGKMGEANVLLMRLGIPFMKKYYVEYDFGKGGSKPTSRVGIALSKGEEVKYKSHKKKKFFG